MSKHRKHRNRHNKELEFNFDIPVVKRTLTKACVILDPGKFIIVQNHLGSYSVVTTCEECQIVIATYEHKNDEFALYKANTLMEYLNQSYD